MSAKADAVLTLALDLPERDRAEIAAALFDSIEPPTEAEVEEAWRQEVARRVAAVDAGEARLVPWEQVRDRLVMRLDERCKG
jgi:putative addiction module component (TIGR02574 family)